MVTLSVLAQLDIISTASGGGVPPLGCSATTAASSWNSSSRAPHCGGSSICSRAAINPNSR